MLEFCSYCNSLMLDGSCTNKHCKNRTVSKKKSPSRSKKKVEEE